MMLRRISVVVAVTALLAVGCGTKKASPTAVGFGSTVLAQGVFPNTNYTAPDGASEFTPTTPMYASIIDFPQVGGETAPTGGHVHPSGFVAGLTGTTTVNLDDGSKVTIEPGQAIFAPPFVHHTHSNPGVGPDDWLFLGVRTEAVRPKALPSPEARVIINTADLPPLVPDGNYVMRLERFTIRPGGQSASVKQGGPTLLYELEGENSLHQAGAKTRTLGFDQAAFLPQGAVYQLRNPSKTDQAQVLVMTMWLQGTPASTIVDTSLS